MRSARPRDPDSHCLTCYLRREICICSMVPAVRTRTEFLILRHIGEAGRPSNTGRLAAMALPNARIIPCGGGQRLGLPILDEERLRNPGTRLLWPDGPGTVPEELKLAPPSRVIVLDATWHQARRLYRRMPVLRTLPRLVLPAPCPQRKRLRDQHRTDGMSTIEAVAAAVALLEGARAAEPLLALYDEVVRRTTTLRWGENRLELLHAGISAKHHETMFSSQ